MNLRQDTFIMKEETAHEYLAEILLWAEEKKMTTVECACFLEYASSALKEICGVTKTSMKKVPLSTAQN